MPSLIGEPFTSWVLLQNRTLVKDLPHSAEQRPAPCANAPQRYGLRQEPGGLSGLG
jgi:hypothetical protein